MTKQHTYDEITVSQTKHAVRKLHAHPDFCPLNCNSELQVDVKTLAKRAVSESVYGTSY